jgi:hypothetical protein
MPVTPECGAHAGSLEAGGSALLDDLRTKLRLEHLDRRCCLDWCGRRCAGPAMVSVLQVRRELGEGDSDTIVNGHVGSDLVVPAS